ncbi:ABC transporter permease [Catellatospora chokoriensis]|uniref:Xylose transport system permease protein XylH n=2 Tax=Catellatospora chokoriensis TaxID=310353 RepID=A0A8J3JX88_9ACTN|nr:ABC transporter permease [Catellatospora chokoriensis]
MSATTTNPYETGEKAAVPVKDDGGLWAYLRSYGQRVRGGDMGALPAVLGIIVLTIVFSAARPSFLTPLNFANLLTQAGPIVVLGMGLVFVLLLGEIDLSAGFASGVCAAVLAIMLTTNGYPWYVGVAAAIATGVVIGLLLGFLVAKVGIPSFVVTLAGFLAFQGTVLWLLKEGTNISVRDEVIISLENEYMPPMVGWALGGLTVLGFAATQLIQQRNRRRRGLPAMLWQVVAFRVVGLAVLVGVAVSVLNEERSRNALFSLKGVPIVVPVIGVLLLLWTFVLRRTAFGRHIYAVGGNREAARRAGIAVDRIRISAFVICSAMAAVSGILAASMARSVDPNTGGSNVLLYGVAAAVIGGTSLFGGKGRVLDAVLGGLVITMIINGMGLVGWSSAYKYVATGVVLLLAASVDAFSRRRSAASS